ncbi:hypothetical protein SCWH03_41970 [Streptomyces pacificus]|uniref:Uncharacterized protein n=1 Tax=Streptomyces pacificus TaxID=2705029 RepID=A0A6A0B2F0_9ACTN|nr:hypothetical protein SCWH03_41970 [Streptomyces pacificus]
MGGVEAFPEADQVCVQDSLGFLCGQVADEHVAGEAVGEGEQGASLDLRGGWCCAFVGRAVLGGLRDEAGEEVLEGRVAVSQRAGEWLGDCGLGDECKPDPCFGAVFFAEQGDLVGCVAQGGGR